MRTCDALGCDRPARGSGQWCERDRQRVAKYGSPDPTPRMLAADTQRAAFARIKELSAAEQGVCWPWPGPRNAKGYGVMAPSVALISSRIVTRNVFAALGEDLGPNEYACHTCDNPPCYRPSHLFRGTAEANSADMTTKGRSGATDNERSGRAKLTNAQVAEIRRMRAAGMALKDIAPLFGIHAAHASRICCGLRRPVTEHPQQAIDEGWSLPRVGAA